MVVGKHLHLFLGRAHEEESTGIEQERRKVLEAVDLVVVLAVRSDIKSGLVAKNEADLDDSGQAGGHEGIAKYSVDHSADLQ